MSKAQIPYLVVNPASAHGATGRRWAKLEKDAREAFGAVEVGFTHGPMEAAALTGAALEAGHRLILAVGGDGTLNEVVNGCFDADGRALYEDIEVGILPCGSGSDFRRSAGVPVKWEEACRQVASSVRRPVDVGRVTFQDFQGRPTSRHFLNIASCGVSANVVQATEKAGKWLGGRLSYKLKTVSALARYRDSKISLSVDGGPAETVPLTALAVSNGEFFGGGLKVSPGARIDDGLFTCTLWGGFHLRDFVLREKKVYSGEHAEWSRTRIFTARTVTAQADERVLLEMDGELVGVLPARFELQAGVLGLRA